MTLDEILAGGADAYGDVNDLLIVDPVTRTINVPSTELILGTENDECGERKWFSMPKVVGNNITVTSCNLRVVYRNANGEKDWYGVKDVTEQDDGSVVFSWELSRKVTLYKGDVQFIVCVCHTVDGVVHNEWNTTLATGKVLEGLEPAEHIDEEATLDIIQQLEAYALRAEAAAAHQPIIGDNGNWLVWENNQYVDSGVSASGVTNIAYNQDTWRWEVTYADGEVASFPGPSILDGSKVTIHRNNFDSYPVGDDTFFKADSRYEYFDDKHGDPTSDSYALYGIAEEGGGKVLKLRCVNSTTHKFDTMEPVVGEYVIGLDFKLETTVSGSRPGFLVNPFNEYRFDVANDTGSMTVAIRAGDYARINDNTTGTQVVHYMMNDDGKRFTPQENVWYSMTLRIELGSMTLRIWERGDESTMLEVACVTDAIGQRAIEFAKYWAVATYAPGSASTPVPSGEHIIWLDELRVWRDLTGPQGQQGVQGPQGIQGPQGAPGVGIADVQYNPDTWRWEHKYTDGSIKTFPGNSPIDGKFTFFRDGFNDATYKLDKHWDNNHKADNVRIATYASRYLRFIVSDSSSRAYITSKYPISGRATIQFDYQPTPADNSGNSTDLLDVRVLGTSVRAGVNYNNSCFLYGLANSGPVRDAAGNVYRMDEVSVWYRVKLIAEVGRVTMKVWKRDTETEPDGTRGGVTVLEHAGITEELLMAERQLRFEFGPMNYVSTAGAHVGYLDNVMVWRDPVEEQDEKSYYYGSLSDAINDINNMVTTNALLAQDVRKSAAIEVSTSNEGRTVVSLLKDTICETPIDVIRDIDLVLAGHELEFTIDEARLSFNEGTVCSINGEVEGSKITKTCTSSTKEGGVVLVRAAGDKLTIRGGSYECTATFPEAAENKVAAIGNVSTGKELELFDCNVVTKCYGTLLAGYSNRGVQAAFGTKFTMVNSKIHAESDVSTAIAVFGSAAELNIDNCEIKSVLTKDGSLNASYGVYLQKGCTASIKNSAIIADAPGSDALDECSIGINIVGVTEDYPATCCYVENTNIYGTHSGIQNKGNLYVRGGILSGWSHGGLYTIHGPDEQVFLKDVQLWGGYYDGQFDISLLEAGGRGSNCYFGYGWYISATSNRGPGGDSYLDGCVFSGGAFCLRDVESGQASTNRLFISNSKMAESATFRVRGAEGAIPAELSIGTGCNFTASQKTSEGPYGIVEETNALYRKHYPSETLTAEDYCVLVDFMNSREVIE